MVDQTQDEILEVQIKNKQIQYSNALLRCLTSG